MIDQVFRENKFIRSTFYIKIRYLPRNVDIFCEILSFFREIFCACRQLFKSSQNTKKIAEENKKKVHTNLQ
jgi:hypothetical protein